MWLSFRPAVFRDLLSPCCLQSVCVRVSHCVPFRFVDDFRFLLVLCYFCHICIYILCWPNNRIYWFLVVYCDASLFFSEILYYLYDINCDRIDTVCSESDCSYALFYNDLYFSMILLDSNGLYVFFCHSLRLCAPTFTLFMCVVLTFFRSITSNTVSPLMMSLSFRPQCLSLYFHYTAATLHSLWSNSVISVLQILFLISCTLWQEACEILILFLYATP